MLDDGTHKMHWGFQILPHAIIIRIFGVVDQSLGEMFENPNIFIPVFVKVEGNPPPTAKDSRIPSELKYDLRLLVGS